MYWEVGCGCHIRFIVPIRINRFDESSMLCHYHYSVESVCNIRFGDGVGAADKGGSNFLLFTESSLPNNLEESWTSTSSDFWDFPCAWNLDPESRSVNKKIFMIDDDLNQMSTYFNESSTIQDSSIEPTLKMAKIEEERQYDSDYESDVDEGNQTTTALGFIDVPISVDEQPELEDTFIGGEPKWLHPNSPPPLELVSCKNCKKPMRLLLQTYSNLENTFYDRIIYIFGCNNSACRRKEGTIRAIRAVRKDTKIMKQRETELNDYLAKEEAKKKKAEEKKKEQEELTKNLFSTSLNDNKSSNPFGASNSSNPFGATGSSNPFGSASSSNPFGSSSSSSATATANPFDTKPRQEGKKGEQAKTSYSQAAASSSVTSDKPTKHSSPQSKKLDVKLPSYPGYLLYIDAESLDPKKQQLPPIPSNIMPSESEDSGEKASQGSSKSSKNSKPGKLTPEQQEIAKMLDDPTFNHFTSILSYNPSQVFRYDLNGSPLLYSGSDSVAKIFNIKSNKGQARIPSQPGTTKRFELQLMPKAIYDLESGCGDEIDILKDGMEWGTIIVATDDKDYVDVGQFDENSVAYVEEWCGVQWEEEVKR
ncbi:unnamed protein product [Ambrosiozyma monospora]|uniref:Unnamed protein product n=1 Tax=Ambrosiozyma monospora TaxID=43982 RepID=A0A9W7DHV2_AMBMO|nr:unnamed protein product [Ambrosiozyma monospora]